MSTIVEAVLEAILSLLFPGKSRWGRLLVAAVLVMLAAVMMLALVGPS